MQSCPQCHQDLADDLAFCPNDGERLSPATVPAYIVADRYRLVSALGEGGMSSVFRAEHIVLGRPFAIKFLAPNLHASPEAVKRFEREAQLASMLRHPNVVSVVDSGCTPDGQLYLVMEYIDGIPLLTVIHQEAPLPVLRVREIVKQVCAALSYAHAQGVIHRDLKSGNIMLTRFETGELVQIVDFGISKTVDGPTLTHVGTLLGTPEFMSPEQISGADIDSRSDLYSLGVVLYESLTGTVPFHGPPTKILTDHLLTPPQPISELRPDLPAGIAAVVMRALVKDPNERFQSAKELAEAFEEACRGIEHGAPFGSSRGHRVARRVGAIAGSLTIGMAALLWPQAPPTSWREAPRATAPVAAAPPVKPPPPVLPSAAFSPAPPPAKAPPPAPTPVVVAATAPAPYIPPPAHPPIAERKAQATPVSLIAAAATAPPAPTPSDTIRQALEHMGAHRYKEARDLLEGLTSVEAVCVRAQARAQSGDAEQAVGDATRCLDLDPRRRDDAALAGAVVRGLATDAGAQALKLLGKELAVSGKAPLLEAARDADPRVRDAAYRASQKLGYDMFDVVAKLILDLPQTRRCKLRRWIVLRLCEIGDRRALPYIERELRRPRKQISCFKKAVTKAVKDLRRQVADR